jgi:alanine dehydrogenase
MPNDAQLLLIDKSSVEQLLQPGEVLAAVHEAFVLHSRREGRVFPVVRESLPTGGIFGIKSGDVPAQGLLGFKAAGFWPANRTLGGEPHQATILLFDPTTGRPTCVIDGNAITAARTGAAGGIGLKMLARADSAQVCVFGTGVQARVQLEFALRLLPELHCVRYVTWKGEPDLTFEAQFDNRCVVEHAQDANSAVSLSDVVITATPGAGPLFDAKAVRPGTHINCVGADTRGKRELADGILNYVRLFVDDREQARQIGETQWASDTPCEEIGDLLTERVRFSRQREDITLFDMTGLALQDLTVARHIQRSAAAQRVGQKIAWSW